MSHLQYFAYPGFGVRALDHTHYSQSVRLPSPTGDIIQISGQGGWNRETEAINPSWGPQIDQAFENVEVALKEAGGKGWSQVYNIHAYLAPLDMEEAGSHVVRNLQKYCPNHKPCLTAVGVEKLAFENMKIEIEVSAHLGT
jgi:enamine deaminase RidA (YjgF/YER057c/UK114 family)